MLVGFLAPLTSPETTRALADAKVTAFAMEAIPRISRAQSTAWAVQALVAAGRDPNRMRRRGSRSPLGYLRTLVAPNGSVRYSRTSAQTPVWVTAQALTALARRPFPIRAPRARR